LTRRDSCHHGTIFLQLEQKQDKRERREPTTDAMRIPGGYQFERPRATFIPYRSKDTSARPDYGGGHDDASAPIEDVSADVRVGAHKTLISYANMLSKCVK
jgi:hypothetical protein